MYHTCTPIIVHYYQVGIVFIIHYTYRTTVEYRVIFNGSYLIAAVTQGNRIKTSLHMCKLTNDIATMQR